MKRYDTVFNFSIRAHQILMRTAVVAVFGIIGTSADAANVVARGNASTNARPTISRANNASSRISVINTRIANAASSDNQNTNNATPGVETPEPATATPAESAATEEPITTEESIIIENKSNKFSTGMMAESSASVDLNAQNLAEMIQRQRAALDTQSASNAAQASAAASLASGQSACDIGLRDCMKQKCGNDYSNCATDGDTIWGDKMDACRRNVTCTGHQYAMFSKEIKADRDMNVKLSSYNKIIDCGNSYNDCIVTECGINYSKCLGKTAGDAAISKCGTIAKNCTQQDSGLASRTMNVFATLRVDAEKQIAADEQRLYEMRDKMRSQCQRLGALFDERSLVCVYTVNFFAGDSTTPMASKKAYAGSSFDCTQDWFGIDVTTFKENAYRYTREAKSASSALMGSGLGQAVGSMTSGAIDRAIDSQKANKALKKAEKEYKTNYGDKESDEDNTTTETPETISPLTPTTEKPEITNNKETEESTAADNPQNVEEYIRKHYKDENISQTDINNIKQLIQNMKDTDDDINIEVTETNQYKSGIHYNIYFNKYEPKEITAYCDELAKNIAPKNISYAGTSSGDETHYGCYYSAKWVTAGDNTETGN